MKQTLLLLTVSFLCIRPVPLFSQIIQPLNNNLLPAATEICDNQIDDDGDGYVDCYDPDCPCFTDTLCSIASIPSRFVTQTAWQSTKNAVSVAATPVVTNMNPQEDDMPEIIIAEAMTNNPLQPGFSNRIQFFRGDGSNAGNPMVLTIAGTSFYNRPVPGPTIGDIDGDGIPELLITCLDRRIRIYHNYTENPVAPMTLWFTSADLLDFADQRPLLADFDGDGTPEVYAGDDIFKFDFSNPANPTLKQVIDGPNNYKGRAYWLQYARGSCNPTAADLLSVADCNGDPDCAGLELAAGAVIYSIDLDPTDGDGYEIKVQRSLPSTAQISFADGYTAVADVDLDGIMDVIVGSRMSGQTGVYAWNKNGLIQFFPYPVNTNLSGALPCIANVFDDRTEGFAQDFPEILVGTSSNFSAYNVQAAQKYPAAPYWWNMNFGGGSGYNPATTFDFNGDGIDEVIFRENELRIVYGGAAPFPPGVDANRNWYLNPAQNVVADEYAVVADVDNDDEAEIVYTTVIGNSQLTDMGRLRVLESGEGPWVPCRNLWNQYNYFVVNVNDDLTIPVQQQLHHLEIPPGSGKRPLNRYLSQQAAPNGIIPLPDASAQTATAFCLNNQLHVQFTVCNTGAQVLKPGTPVAFYTSDPTTSNAALAAPPYIIPTALQPDSCLQLDIPFPLLSGVMYGVVNDDGTHPRPYNLATDFPVNHVFECNWLNNRIAVDYSIQAPALDLGPDIITCSDTALLLDAGPGHLSYLWQDNSTARTFPAQGPGVFWVRVQDDCAGPRTDTIRLVATGSPQIQLDTVNGDCNGLPASASVTAISQQLPLAYKWSTGLTGPVLSGVPDGVYTVTVTDAKGCSSVDSTWIEAGGLLQATFSTTDIPCNGQTGAIDIAVTFGTPPFNFAWSNASTGNLLPNIPAGTYTGTITDADACKQVLQILLTQPPPLISLGIAADTACPGVSNGGLHFLGASQGTPPYTLQWSTGVATPDITGLAAGTYDLLLTDAHGCTLMQNATIPDYSAPAIDTLVQPISCFGANDGGIAVSLTGGTPGFSYSWSNALSTPTIQSLSPGLYSLTLTYAGGHCAQVLGFTISEPLPLLSAGITAVASCPGTASGSAGLLGITQGTMPYTYLWTGGGTSPGLNGLAAGTYSVLVTDANGCTLSESVQVDEFLPPTIDSALTQVSCAGAADGSIQLILSGGTLGYGYLWSNGQTTPGIQNLGPGPYSVVCSYADGQCAQPFDFLITEPPPLLSGGITTTAACPGQSNGSAAFLGASQGTAPYSLIWSTNSSMPVLDSIPGGNYALTVTDARGCSLVENIQVPEFISPMAGAVIQPITCAGSTDGSISVNISGGTPGFGYAWSNGNITPDIQNLGPGTYTLTLTYADNACSTVFNFSVTEPQPLVSQGIAATAACGGDSNGVIEFLGAAQGTPPYALLWSNTATTSLVTGLASGVYTLTITDANGCTATDTAQVPEFATPVVDTLTQDVTCFAAQNGSITTIVSGNTPVLGYVWSNSQTGSSLSGLGPGNYSLTVTYGDGSCVLTYSFQLIEPAALQLAPAQITPVNCFGEANGSIAITPSGGTQPYLFTWPGGQTSATLQNAVAGDYPLTLTDANGCSVTASFKIAQPALLEATPATLQADTCQAGTGAVVISAAGGTQPYAFSWSNGPGTPGLTALAAGTYTLTLSDAHGCTRILPVVIPAWDAVPKLAPFTDTITCVHPVATIGVVADQPNLQFAWSTPGGGSLPDQANQTVSAAGLYTVAVSNGYGCTSSAQLTVVADTIPPFADAGPDQVAAPCDATQVQLNASGSTAGVAFVPHWSRSENGAIVFDTMAWVIPATAPGLYIFSNTNSINGCTASDSVWVDWAPPIVAMATVEPVSCNGASDGTIRVEHLAGGTAPIEYSIDNQLFSANNIFGGLGPGIYPAIVRDASGCQWDTILSIGQPAPFSVVLTASDTLLELGQYVYLKAVTAPPGLVPVSISWSPANAGLLPDVLQQQNMPEETTEFEVEITDGQGCKASDRVLVEVANYQFYAPNAFSTGAPGNDRFTLYTGPGIREIKLLQVYDRWGELLFENRRFAPNDPAAGWDGRFRSSWVAPGVFLWYAELEGKDGRVLHRTGDVTVVRRE